MRNLDTARALSRNDCYTLIETIAVEIPFYIDKFRDKTIYCNCDVYNKSNFVKYFSDNFTNFGLKALVATNFHGALNADKAYKYVKTADNETVSVLEDNGDFRSDECIELLEKSDIVITNPPFSLIQPFVQLVLSKKKEFIILSNFNAAAYSSIFDLIKNEVINYGYSIHSGAVDFAVPPEYLDDPNCKAIDGKVRISGIRWFTTFKTNNNFKEPRYSFDDISTYQKYDNYDCIEVSSVHKIPRDYTGIMGVPISFIDFWDKSKYKIVGMHNKLKLNGKNIFKRIIIQKII